ncbi:hypothetical protein GCM10027280_14170 [Micromonospora polyrhachis]
MGLDCPSDISLLPWTACSLQADAPLHSVTYLLGKTIMSNAEFGLLPRQETVLREQDIPTDGSARSPGIAMYRVMIGAVGESHAPSRRDPVGGDPV